MDWNNIDLKDGYERDQNFLDGYDFETLLLDIHCNMKEITKEAILAHVKNEMAIRVRSANEIIEANIDNIVKYAKKERSKK